jgi:hypothetical protein
MKATFSVLIIYTGCAIAGQNRCNECNGRLLATVRHVKEPTILVFGLFRFIAAADVRRAIDANQKSEKTRNALPYSTTKSDTGDGKEDLENPFRDCADCIIGTARSDFSDERL